MDSLKTMQDKVVWVLKNFPVCRDDDNLLIGAIYKYFYDVDPKTTVFSEILLRDNLPKFETIRRCRQKAQEMLPHLGPTLEAKARRREHYQRVRAYALQEEKWW